MCVWLVHTCVGSLTCANLGVTLQVVLAGLGPGDATSIDSYFAVINPFLALEDSLQAQRVSAVLARPETGVVALMDKYVDKCKRVWMVGL